MQMVEEKNALKIKKGRTYKKGGKNIFPLIIFVRL
jgi:hypothetical protein